MNLLLTAATAAEIQPVIDHLEKNELIPHSHEVEVLITGVGAVATTWSLARTIINRRPDLIIQAGIAGCFREYEPGKTLAIEEDSFGDLGVWENNRFNTIFDLKLADDSEPPYTNGTLANPNKKLLQLSGIEQVKAITVNEITTDTKRIDWYQQNVSPVVESMEGAAFHYVCLQEKIPFIQLRSVSNLIGERDKAKWNLKQAITQLNEKLFLLLNELSKYDETDFRI